ncbi:hypothetical protein C7431_10817 [Pantoea allii]|uniref:Uncharacterized protein n=1 Tax=Pantoea allii TaxID=574096 RepID=A0A2V2B828_9GAMM|nr:hypothetical protein C7431_10817 [Pantoea allii]
MPVIIIWRIILVRIQNNDLFNAFRMRINRMDMKIAKANRQRTMLFGRNNLVTQEQDLVAQQRMIELFKLRITERTGYIKVANLGTNKRPEWLNL